VSNLTDIRTARSKKDEETRKKPSTPRERAMRELVSEVSSRLNELEKRQRRIDAILGRILTKLDSKPKGGG
jgi:regulator of sirC expression with transglutaminase-like and TPR domain